MERPEPRSPIPASGTKRAAARASISSSGPSPIGEPVHEPTLQWAASGSSKSSGSSEASQNPTSPNPFAATEGYFAADFSPTEIVNHEGLTLVETIENDTILSSLIDTLGLKQFRFRHFAASMGLNILLLVVLAVLQLVPNGRPLTTRFDPITIDTTDVPRDLYDNISFESEPEPMLRPPEGDPAPSSLAEKMPLSSELIQNDPAESVMAGLQQDAMLKDLFGGDIGVPGKASTENNAGIPGGLGDADGGAGGSAEFFGTSVKARKIVYVIDRSQSMALNSGVPMSLARRELIRSVDQLSPSMQFHIVFYNHEVEHLRGGAHRTYMKGGKSDRERAIREIGVIQPAGGTNHRDALLAALQLKPEVIFFLTDAEDDEARIQSLITEITRLNGQKKRGTHIAGPATIHVVHFHNDSGFSSTAIAELAKKNKGTYREVDTSGQRENQ